MPTKTLTADQQRIDSIMEVAALGHAENCPHTCYKDGTIHCQCPCATCDVRKRGIEISDDEAQDWYKRHCG